MDKKNYWANIFILAFMAIASIESTFIVNLMASFHLEVAEILAKKATVYTLFGCFEFFDLLIKPIFILIMVCIFITNIVINKKHIHLSKHYTIGLIIIFYSIYSSIFFNVLLSWMNFKQKNK